MGPVRKRVMNYKDEMDDFSVLACLVSLAFFMVILAATAAACGYMIAQLVR